MGEKNNNFIERKPLDIFGGRDINKEQTYADYVASHIDRQQLYSDWWSDSANVSLPTLLLELEFEDRYGSEFIEKNLWFGTNGFCDNPVRTFMDAGYVYAPYIPMMVTEPITDLVDFEPQKNILSRYAEKTINKNYYGVVNIKQRQVGKLAKFKKEVLKLLKHFPFNKF